jgi:hypothetical protein
LDTRILHNEKRDVMRASAKPWNVPGRPIENLYIEGRPPGMAYNLFMARFNFLTGKLALASTSTGTGPGK